MGVGVGVRVGVGMGMGELWEARKCGSGIRGERMRRKEVAVGEWGRGGGVAVGVGGERGVAGTGART